MTVRIHGRARVVSDALAERISRGLEGALASQSRDERHTIAADDIRALREDVGIAMADDRGRWGSDALIAGVLRGLAGAASDAARALRAIPSERRAQASRDNGAKSRGRPTGHPVRVIPATADGMGKGIGLDCPPVRDRAASRTGAMRAARRAGYRVMESGGCVELHEPDGGPSEWWVTVYPRER